MVVPEWMSLERVGMIAALTLILVQYVKAAIPEKLIPVASLLIAILVAFLFDQAEINPYVRMVLYGVFATAGADTTYGFLNNSRSPTFTLPSKGQMTGGK